MTDLLLDTNAALWLVQDSPQLGSQARELMASTSVWVSAASVWEVAIKQRSGKLALKGDFIDGLARAQARELEVGWEHLKLYGGAALPHGDPFDHILVAQAQSEGMLFLTADRVILANDLPFVRDARS